MIRRFYGPETLRHYLHLFAIRLDIKGECPYEINQLCDDLNEQFAKLFARIEELEKRVKE